MKTADPATIARIRPANHKANAPAECTTYPDPSHFLFAESGLEEVAGDVLGWLANKGFEPVVKVSSRALPHIRIDLAIGDHKDLFRCAG